MIRNTSGRRLSSEIQNSEASASWTVDGSKADPDGGVSSPSSANPARAISDSRPGRPQHRADVLLGRHVADHRGHQHRRLGDRRHLVAEVGAGDDRAGGDHRIGADQRRQRDEGDAESRGGGPRAADGQAHQAADDGCGRVEPLLVQQSDAVVDDGRDGAGHVPGADQRADAEQDVDGAHCRADTADGRIPNPGRGVTVLQGHRPGHQGAGEERDLQRPAGRIGPEQADGQPDQEDQRNDRDQRVQHGRRARRVGLLGHGESCSDSSMLLSVRAGPAQAIALIGVDWRVLVPRLGPRQSAAGESQHQYQRHDGDDGDDPGRNVLSFPWLISLRSGPAGWGTSCSGRRRGPCRARNRRSRSPPRRPPASSRW